MKLRKIICIALCGVVTGTTLAAVPDSPASAAIQRAPASCVAQTFRFDQAKGSKVQPCVQHIQRLLKAAGKYPDATDGIFGRRTANAIANFKSTQKLARNDTVDRVTWAALHAPKKLPAGTPASCIAVSKKSKKVICQNEAYQRVYAFENGRLVMSIPARFGGLALNKQGKYERYRTAMGVTRSVVSKHLSTNLGGWGTMQYALRTNSAYAFIHLYTPTAHPNDNGHGCVNLLDTALTKRLYGWANVGTPVFNRAF